MIQCTTYYIVVPFWYNIALIKTKSYCVQTDCFCKLNHVYFEAIRTSVARCISDSFLFPGISNILRDLFKLFSRKIRILNIYFFKEDAIFVYISSYIYVTVAKSNFSWLRSTWGRRILKCRELPFSSYIFSSTPVSLISSINYNWKFHL